MRKYFDRFSEWLVGFGIEAYLHILMTIVIAMCIARVCYFTGADKTLAGYIGALLAFLVGFVKESWDNKTEGVFEAGDIVANVIGAVLFVLCWARFTGTTKCDNP